MSDYTEEVGYSSVTAIVYVFNLIVGTGALALPSAVAKAGWVPGTLLLSILGLISYMTVTFIIETLAAANAVGRQRTLQVQYRTEEDDTPLLDSETDIFEIRRRFEISELASGLLSRSQGIIVVVCLIAYLFGDLSIYCAVIARTLAHTSCTRPTNISCNATIPDTELCWEWANLSRLDVYRLFVCLVVTVLCPIVFANMPKIKWLQLLTTFMRWSAFSTMIIWSIVKLATDGPKGSHTVANVYAIPTLFGTCVYSFMCQHSIPGLIDPIANKMKFLKILPFNYAQIACFYILVSLTAVWTFSRVEDLYTLNFWTDGCNGNNSSIIVLDYFLALFPVFTLGSSFPIIAITLRNNLIEILPDRRWLKNSLPLVTCVIPAVLALIVPDLSLLVGVVGSYAGTALQYVAPALLVTEARSRCENISNNPYKSPFSGTGWIIFIYVWSGFSLTLITINYVSMLISWIHS